MRSFQSALILCGVTATLAWGCLRAEAATGEECRELVRNKCAICHFVTYICPRIEKGKGTLSWRGIIHDMVKEGLVATDQEQDRLVGCLAAPDAKLKELCPVKK